MKHARTLYLAALLLPLVFLGLSCLYNVYSRTVLPVYSVVIKAYDPHDLLHGKYMQFRYDWDDPQSQKPHDIAKEKLPQHGRFYLPEDAAGSLQQMIFEKDRRFTADVSFMGDKTIVREIHVDGDTWQAALKRWRERPAKAPAPR